MEDVSARTEAVVSKAIKNLLELCRECGIVNDDGVVVDPERLFNTDEKGLSQRSDSVARGVIARHQSSRASAVSSSPTWQHITVASFISLSGRRYPTGVVVSTSTVHQDFAQLWPKAFFYPNKGGSVTAAIFADMVQQCLARPARDFHCNWQATSPVLGQWRWQLASFERGFPQMLLAVRHQALFYPAWTTKALCPLDQVVHSTMARLWAQWKQLWSHKRQPFTLFVALKAAGEIVDEALKPEAVKASWAQCGFCANELVLGVGLFMWPVLYPTTLKSGTICLIAWNYMLLAWNYVNYMPVVSSLNL